MSLREPRVGIERKILTSILWVGILPMTVALIVAYITARGGQSKAVQDTLLTAAQKTAEGLQFVTDDRLNRARGMATAPEVIEALTAGPSGELRIATDPDLQSRVIKHLSHLQLSAEGPAPVVSLYGMDGGLLTSTRQNVALPNLDPEWLEHLQEAGFHRFGSIFLDGEIAGMIGVRVREPESGHQLGFLTLHVPLEGILRFALGGTIVEGREAGESDQHQIVHIDEQGNMLTVQLAEEDTGLPIPFNVFQPDENLAAVLRDHPSSGAMLLNDYQIGQGEERTDVLLAYQHMTAGGLEGQDVYMVVFRPIRAVFGNINLFAALAFLGCTLFIAFLCVNAYRDVHNNIVRPVSLLNEGAQIIRQGDFDLKLKIGTGDEIEELASSFNKMALALKGNIRQLEDSEEKYRSLVTTMRDGIYQTDVDGVITFLNPAGVEILGFPDVDSAIGTNIRAMFLDDEDFDPFSDKGEMRDSGERSRIWMRRADKRTICVALSLNRVYDENGVPIALEGIFRDVTKNVRLEEEAKDRAERISAINQIANVINSSLEAGRLYESLVVELKKIVNFDYAAVALMSERGMDFDARQLWPDHEVHPGFTFTLKGQDSCSGWVARERKCLLVEDLRQGGNKFGDQFPDSVRSCMCVPLYATGRIIGTLNLGSETPSAYQGHDVEVLEQMAPHLAVAIRNAQLLVNLQLSLEEVTRAREKLHEANEELKTLDEMKTNLLSNVSHELRTPLVAVMGYNDMILNGKAGPINNNQREYLSISLRNIEKLVTLIENLLDFSRLHRGDERLVFDTFDLVDCARTSIQVIKPVVDSRDIAVTLSTPEDPILVEGDKGKIGQIFNNLLSNAAKFNHSGGRIDVTMKLAGGFVEVSVSDTGIGIPEEAQEKVFTRFYQYDSSSTRKYGGTGIGLAIAQDIARLHGSTITVSSDEGKGSNFRFQMALAGERRMREDGSGYDESQELPPPEETRMLIELVSYDRALSSQLRHIFSNEGMDLISASTAANAILLAQKHNPDCILVDLGNSDTSRDVLDEVLQNPYTGALPVIMMSNDDELYENYRRLVAARVKRSFRKSSLLSGIQHALSQEVNVAEPVGEKILCVDDDPEILMFMARCLQAEGYTVDTVRGGEGALERVMGREYGLVLLDIAMPGMDGWETCKRIREEPTLAGIKIYMVTAKPIEHNIKSLQEAGADGFLLKPFRPEDLVQLVQGLEIQNSAP